MRALLIALLCLGSLVLGACGPTSPTASPVATSPSQGSVTTATPQAADGLPTVTQSTPSPTVADPLTYFWPAEIPQGLQIDISQSFAGDTGYQLVFETQPRSQTSLAIRAGDQAPQPRGRTEAVTIRGLPGAAFTTGAGYSIVWQEDEVPYVVAGGGLEATLAFAEVLEAVSGAVWQQRLADAAPTTGEVSPTTSQPAVSLKVCIAPEVTAAPAMVIVQLTWHCGQEPYTVDRAVLEAGTTEQLLTHTLEALLAGPTVLEQAAGFVSWFAPATAGRLNGVTLDAEGHATVDFATFSALIPNASASAGSAMLLAELRQTVFQFPEVQSVTFQFDGSCDAFWNWLQMSCQQVVRA